MPAPVVTVRQSRFWATNTTIVTTPGGCLLVDPGVYPDELRSTAAALSRPLLAAVHTHAHWDHVLWAPELDAAGSRPESAPRPTDAVPRFVTDGTRSLLEIDRPRLLVQLVEVAAGHEPGTEPGEPWETALVGLGAPLPDGTPVPWAGPTALLLRTDAHLPGHGSLHLPELGLLVTGDLVSDVDVPLPHWSDPPVPASSPAAAREGIAPYRAALDRLGALGGVTRVIPGHGSPTDRQGFLQRVDRDRRYLDHLEAVVDASDTGAEVRARAARLPDDRLRNPDVRGAHDTSVRLLLLSRQRPAAPGR